MILNPFATALMTNVLAVSVNGSSKPFRKVGRNPIKSTSATTMIAQTGFSMKR
jgi:hypothetical protein